MSNINKKLKKLYFNVKTGYISVFNLNKLKITLNQAKDFVFSQLPNQLTTPHNRLQIYNTINAPASHNYQLNIMVYDHYAYHQYKYVFYMIDIYF